MIIVDGKKIPNTFGLEVKAHRWVEYTSEEELLDFIRRGALEKPYLHVGAGSNLLFLDDYRGTVLHSGILGVECVRQDDETVWLRVGSGMVWDDLVAYCVQQGYYGAENLSLIPGEVGAAAVQNIGAYGVEMKDLVVCVETIDDAGRKRAFPVEECAYAYRKSIFKQPEMKSVFVTYVILALSRKETYKLDYGTIRQELAHYPQVSLAAVRKVIMDIRGSKLPDPQVLGNAGSFFMNPLVEREKFEELLCRYPSMPHYPAADGRVKIPAGWMIEQCGWKGKALGPAAVHDRQALVLVNRGGATGKDIVALSNAVRSDVWKRFGVSICPEVNFIG